MNKKNFLDDKSLENLCNDFKALADVNRLKILLFLSSSEQSVNAISQNINLGQSATSHHLRILKDASIVKMRRQANINYYSVADEHISDVLKTSIRHLDCKN